MTVIDDLLGNNTRYAERFDKGDLPLPPGLRLAVVACMDARLDTHRLLGIGEGDAHVIRNAGGVVTEDVIRDLALADVLVDVKVCAVDEIWSGLKLVIRKEHRAGHAALHGAQP